MLGTLTEEDKKSDVLNDNQYQSHWCYANIIRLNLHDRSEQDLETYSTSEIATMIGVHPNTIRFYEEQALLPPIPRKDNGYRVFFEKHLLQLRFIRCAFKAEILNNNLRNEAIAIVKMAAENRFNKAILQTALYGTYLREEIAKARDAISLTEQLLNGVNEKDAGNSLIDRQEAAARIGVSIHILRDWERNGLITVPRKGNRRQYGMDELKRMKIISVLRNGGYSQMSIRRMFVKLVHGEMDLLLSVDTPEETEDIISVTDRYITSLSGALQDADKMRLMLETMKSKK